MITALTIFALFGDDIRVLAFDRNADLGFDVVSIICLCAFFSEIVLGVLCKPGYFLSFFFWLDLVSTLSLILDIGMISKDIGLSDSSATNTA